MRALLIGLGYVIVIAAGCGSSSPQRPAETPEPPPPRMPSPASPSIEQARARADMWAREDAESEQQAAEQARRRAEEDAARAREEERVRAELDKNPFKFEGEFHAGGDSCAPTYEFKFRNVKSLSESCKGCRCEHAARRSAEGTTWTAECEGGKAGRMKTKLFISNRAAPVPATPSNASARDAALTRWQATYEESVRGSNAVSCGYVGWMTDLAGRWKQAQTQINVAGGDYDLPAQTQ